MAEIDVLRKEIGDTLLQITEKYPEADFVDGMVVNARLTPDDREEIEKKLARLKELEG